MRAHYEKAQAPSRNLVGIGARLSRDSVGGLNLVWLDCKFGDLPWQTAVFEDTGDSLLLDWESFVLYADIAWRDFVESESEAPHNFRVKLRRDSYYNYRYDDAERLACFYLQDSTNSATCWAYAPRDSLAANTLERLFERQMRFGARPEIKVTLRLRFEKHTDGGSHQQAWIDGVVSDSWFVPY